MSENNDELCVSTATPPPPSSSSSSTATQKEKQEIEFHRTNSENKMIIKDKDENSTSVTYSWQRSQSEMLLDSSSNVKRLSSTTTNKKATKSTDKVSQHSKVYWDLSRGDDESNKYKVNLQTIQQKEEIKPNPSSITVSATSSKIVRSSRAEQQRTKKTYFSNFNTTSPNLQILIRNALPIWKSNVIALKEAHTENECLLALDELNDMLIEAWSLPIIGKDLAHSLCDALRTCGGIEMLLKLCFQTSDCRLSAAKLLEQSMILKNCDVVVENGLNAVIELSKASINESALQTASTGILQHLFKHAQTTCTKLVEYGALDVLLNACKAVNKPTLCHCSKALANLALYSDDEIKLKMVQKHVGDWLFPLAFNDDDSIRYYAFLAIEILASTVPSSAIELKNSGSLKLVKNFIENHDPTTLALSDTANLHGHTEEWLKKLVPILDSCRQHAQTLAAFHFAMECVILKRKGESKEILERIDALQPLNRIVMGSNKLAAKFAKQALEYAGVQLPSMLSYQVSKWSITDIKQWLDRISFDDLIPYFEKDIVDGDLLLKIDQLQLDIGLKNVGYFRRMKFFRELRKLKIANELDEKTVKLGEWLENISPELIQYAYQMHDSGVDSNTLPLLTNEHLLNDCNINNGIHRIKILERIKRQSLPSSSSYDGQLNDSKYDVFISYRRNGGSLLASLLKVHLQVRGYRVFLDIEKLQAGKFDNKLLDSVKAAQHFILVLTPQALDRCLGDEKCSDWVHREIVAAIRSGCNIIPVEENFDWPTAEKLPEDMRTIGSFNSIRWIHDYQDACVDKLQQFLNNAYLSKK